MHPMEMAWFMEQVAEKREARYCMRQRRPVDLRNSSVWSLLQCRVRINLSKIAAMVSSSPEARRGGGVWAGWELSGEGDWGFNPNPIYFLTPPQLSFLFCTMWGWQYHINWRKYPSPCPTLATWPQLIFHNPHTVYGEGYRSIHSSIEV